VRGFLLVGLGGGLGSTARYAVNLAIGSLWLASFPFGTLLVNVGGCAAIGFAAAAALHFPGVFSQDEWALAVVGFLGGFTTFSAFGLETVGLFGRSGRLAVANLVLHLGLGLGAVLAGRAFGDLILGPGAPRLP
jgi:CrcB protein